MNKFLYSLLLTIFFNIIPYTYSYELKGIVKDLNTKETIFGATIVSSNDFYTTSDIEGNFIINNFSEKNTLFISSLGYKKDTFLIDIISDTIITFYLKETAKTLNDIVLIGNTKAEAKSGVKKEFTGVNIITKEELKKLPVFLGETDVTKAIQTQAGVSSTGEGSSGFNVRGGNIDQNLILIDGMPTFNSSHIFGFFSAFNPLTIESLNLYKGGIPAKYGGKGSSVLEITQKDSILNEFKGEAGLSILFSKVGLEIPLKKEKLSLLVGARRSYFDIFFPLLPDDLSGTNIHFQDFNTKLNWKLNDANRLFVSVYHSKDMYKLSFADATFSVEFPNTNNAIGINWIYNKENLNVHNSVIYTSYDYSFDVSDEESSGGGGPSNISISNPSIFSNVEKLFFKSDWTKNLNINTNLNFGAEVVVSNYTPGTLEDSEGTVYTEGTDEKTISPNLYLNYNKKLENVDLNLGARFWYFANLGSQTLAIYENPEAPTEIIGYKEYSNGEVIKDYWNIEPRVSINYYISDLKSLKVGYNRVLQNMHLISNTYSAVPFDTWKPSGYYIKPLEVNQISAAYNFDTPLKEYSFGIESFYKKFNNLLEYRDGANLFLNDYPEQEITSAEGYAYGIELSANKNIGDLTGFINYTYSRSLRRTTSNYDKFQINNNEWFASNYDRPHVFNMSSVMKLSDIWDFSLFFTLQSGRPITLPTGTYNISVPENTESSSNEVGLVYSDRNAYRLKPTHRLDVAFTKKLRFSEKKNTYRSSIIFGIYNLYNRRNPFSIYSSTDDNGNITLNEFSVIGSMIPYITYNFIF